MVTLCDTKIKYDSWNDPPSPSNPSGRGEAWEAATATSPTKIMEPPAFPDDFPS